MPRENKQQQQPTIAQRKSGDEEKETSRKKKKKKIQTLGSTRSYRKQDNVSNTPLKKAHWTDTQSPYLILVFRSSISTLRTAISCDCRAMARVCSATSSLTCSISRRMTDGISSCVGVDGPGVVDASDSETCGAVCLREIHG